MGNYRATLRRRHLGRALRELREQAGMTLEEAAPQLDLSTSTLSRTEKGQQGVTVHLVRSMLDLYDVGGERWGELIDLTRQARKPGWWRAYGLDDYGYIPLEAEADLVREYTLGFVPGLLQTEEYAAALFQGGALKRTSGEIEQQLRIRMIRQQRLRQSENPLELIAVFDESVLHRPVGGPVVMRGQLTQLIEAAEQDRVTYQILPLDLGARPALAAGFIVLSFGSLGLPDVAYIEHPLGSVQIDKEAETRSASMTFDQLRSLALSPADSVALVRKVAEQM